ncbi:polymorphic toxin-type HINT domain-containing protein [Amycolatopsis mediterranei]|uniref:polymorphic toxin-type HINT domain-containing protein n=1 Tax=Amycolatopsis mediterranei TaxID=33910 RepID=UPI00342DD946
MSYSHVRVTGRRAWARVLARALAVVLTVTMAQAVALPADAAAGGPSVPLPNTSSVPVSGAGTVAAPPDAAGSSALHGDQPASSGGAGAGNSGATPLSPSATWQVSGQTGDFSWNYPMRVPPVPGGLTPNLALSYTSSAVDGQTEVTNNQPGWLGDGWSMWPGAIDRTYASCLDVDNPAPETTADLCWRSDNATATYSGGGGQLIRDDKASPEKWRPKSDDGSRVERLWGADNGAWNGEYWKITTIDGTQYFFGSEPSSHSTWTVPVFFRDAIRCHGATFETSSCNQAWRWNLDKVIDRHGNEIRYYYNAETNKYALDRKAAGVSYVRGGTLDHIDYGLRVDNPSAGAVARVEFGLADRCVPGSDCVQSKPANWPDVPWESSCTGDTCDTKKQDSPSFFSTKRLTTVTTKISDGAGGFRDVDSWTLDQQYPDPGDGEKAALWLKGVTHTGEVGGSVAVPEVTFQGTAYPNRVVKIDGLAVLNRYRITGVVSEAGGVTAVQYADADCTAANLPKPESNSQRCFPVTWAPRDYAPRTDWFQKYAVAKVSTTDRYSSSPAQVVSYEYLDGAAWHYNTSEFVRDNKKTWDEWHGYDRVRIRTGTPDDPSAPVTMSEQRFYRGMDGDKTPTGTRHVQVADSEGGQRDDSGWLDGFGYESATFNGENGPVIAKSITTPVVQGPTSVRGAYQAYLVRPARVVNYTALDSGWRTTHTDTSYDDKGLPTQVDDYAAPDDEKCVRTSYQRNTDAWLIDYPSRVEVVSVGCATTPKYPDNAVVDAITTYDAVGDPLGQQSLTGYDAAGKPQYYTKGSATFDAYGRARTSTDGVGNVTKADFVPDTGGPVTGTVTTDPAGFTRKMTLDPAWGVPVKDVDANNGVSENAYDALGRLVEVWGPDRDRSRQRGSVQYSYSVHNDAPTVVTTTKIGPNGNYAALNTLLDGLYRQRQIQAPAPGGGRLISDVRYNSHGTAYETTAPYYNDGAVDTNLVLATETGIPLSNVTKFDGAGRPVTAVTQGYGAEKWHSSMTYHGDHVDGTPPAGGPPTTSWSDERGRQTALWQYHGPTPTGDHDVTSYAFNQVGEPKSMTDAAGNSWTWGYDLRGQAIAKTDPDTGTTATTYDDDGRPVSVKDARGVTVVSKYDSLGRQVEEHQDSLTGPLLVERKFDTVTNGKGLPASEARYDNGNVYTTTIGAYTKQGQVLSSTLTIPAVEKGLAGSYTTYSRYNPDASLASSSLPAIGSLPQEPLLYTYDDLGHALTFNGGYNGDTFDYVTDVQYTKYGEAQRIQLGDTGKRTWLSLYYDDTTRRLNRQIVDAEVPAPMQADVNYGYDNAGNVTKIADTPLGKTADTQCFGYDYLRRLSNAWTPSDGDCGVSPDKATLGGAAPYRQSFGYDLTGNRTSETDYGVTGAGNTVKTFNYPKAGGPQPHTLSSVDTTLPDGSKQHDASTYDEVGNTKSRQQGSTVDQTLVWNAENELASITDNKKKTTTSYLRDANGNQLIRRDPTGSTLYLDGQELHVDLAGNTPTPTRYYTMGKSTVAVRTGSGLHWIAGDDQNTQSLSIDAGTLAVSQRRFLPFGGARGSSPADWPDQKGFVGGNDDPSTGLTLIGARPYDASAGRFLAIDPQLDTSDPQSMNGYAYAGNSPKTFSDPSGMWCDGCNDGNGWTGVHGGNNDGTDYDHGGGTGGGASSAPPKPPTVKVKDTRTQRQSYFKSKGYNKQGVIETYETTYLDLEIGGDCPAGFIGPCAPPRMVTIEDSVLVSTTCYICQGKGQNGGVVGCPDDTGTYEPGRPSGPSLSDFADLAKAVIFDPGACIGADASVGSCLLELASVVPVGKVLKGVKVGDEILKGILDAYKGGKDAERVGAGAASCALHSFAGGTEVVLADGSTKPIDQVRPGDVVEATDPATGKTAPHKVIATIVHGDEGDLTHLTVSGGGSLDATSWHPVWVDELGQFVPIGNLVVGEHVKSADGTHTAVTAVRRYQQVRPVYDLTIEGVHTYYVVADDTSVLVHNCAEDLYAIEDHVKPRHIEGGELAQTGKSLFDDEHELESLAQASAGRIGIFQKETNNIRYFITADHVIGKDRSGMPTRIYTVIRSARDGELVTMHPGLPSDIAQG